MGPQHEDVKGLRKELLARIEGGTAEGGAALRGSSHCPEGGKRKKKGEEEVGRSFVRSSVRKEEETPLLSNLGRQTILLHFALFLALPLLPFLILSFIAYNGKGRQKTVD